MSTTFKKFKARSDKFTYEVLKFAEFIGWYKRLEHSKYRPLYRYLVEQSDIWIDDQVVTEQSAPFSINRIPKEAQVGDTDKFLGYLKAEIEYLMKKRDEMVSLDFILKDITEEHKQGVDQ